MVLLHLLMLPCWANVMQCPRSENTASMAWHFGWGKFSSWRKVLLGATWSCSHCYQHPFCHSRPGCPQVQITVSTTYTSTPCQPLSSQASQAQQQPPIPPTNQPTKSPMVYTMGKTNIYSESHYKFQMLME